MAFGFSHSFTLPQLPEKDLLDDFMKKYQLTEERGDDTDEIHYAKSEFTWAPLGFTLWFYFGTQIKVSPKGTNEHLVTISNKPLSFSAILLPLGLLGFYAGITGGNFSILGVLIALLAALILYFVISLQLFISSLYLKRKVKELLLL